MARHSFADHTGELEVRIEGGTLAELFAEAARALAEIVGGPAGDPGTGAWEPVQLVAPDRNALLVDWLNELIFRSERDKTIFDDVLIEQISDRALAGAIRGRPIEDLRLHVKAATFHRLDIEEQPRGGLAANLVLDV